MLVLPTFTFKSKFTNILKLKFLEYNSFFFANILKVHQIKEYLILLSSLEIPNILGNMQRKWIDTINSVFVRSNILKY